MSGQGSVGVRFSDGSVEHVTVDATRMFDAVLFDGFFGHDDGMLRSALAGIRADSLADDDGFAPAGAGLLAIDCVDRKIFLHLQDADRFDRMFASRGIRSPFVRHAAALRRAYLVSDTGVDLALTPAIVDAAADLLASPGRDKTVAGLGRVAWLTGEIRIDFAGWDVRMHRQSRTGAHELLRDLVRSGFPVDDLSPAWSRWREEIPQVA